MLGFLGLMGGHLTALPETIYKTIRERLGAGCKQGIWK